MPGLNKVYLPLPRPVVLHVCAFPHPFPNSLPDLSLLIEHHTGRAGGFQGKEPGPSSLCLPLSQDSLVFIKEGELIPAGARQVTNE